MSQAQLADLLSVEHGITIDPTAITRMEKGRRTIRLNEAAAIAAILGIRLFDLIAPEPFVYPDLDLARSRAAAFGREIERLDKEIEETGRAAIQARDAARKKDSQLVELRRQHATVATLLRRLSAFIAEEEAKGDKS